MGRTLRTSQILIRERKATNTLNARPEQQTSKVVITSQLDKTKPDLQKPQGKQRYQVTTH